MAGDVNSNIFINIDTSQAMAQLRALEKELTSLNRALIIGTKTAAQAQSKYAQSLLHNVNATGQWTASTTRMKTATEQFATALDRSKLSLKEYFRFGVASSRNFGRVFGSEFDTVGKLVEKRVKVLQQQYVQLGRDAQGAMNALKFTPKNLNYRDVTTQLMMATQRQQIFNKLLDDGATKLLNFGKNTQWAGRQLMVGFTIPLMLFGSQAIKTFKEIETQVIRFKKVYGDIFTDQGATEQALKNIRSIADEYTKFGVKVADTVGMAADAAAAGFSGKQLEKIVEQTNKLAVLGGVTQEKALETTIALSNAFKINESELSGTIDFLNAVENQTVVALEDLTEAVPRVAPVIQQLGGDVKDLAYFMAAMQEGGISAAQGANALKSGLASLINPSTKASKAAAELGINLKGIIEENQGNLRNIVTAFAKSLQPLTDLQRTRIIEQVFGKYQFARISALLNNIGKEGTQAARVLELTNASAEELAILSQRELKIQAESPMNKFAGAVERLRKAIAPVGEIFAKTLTPVIEFITKMADKFNKLPDGIKKAIAIIAGVVGGLGPIFLMTFGLVANAFANTLKGVNMLRKGFQQIASGSSDVALKTQYLTNEELENISVTNALYSKHEQLSAAYRLEQQALASLMATYNQANVAMGGFAAKNPGLFIPGRGVAPRRFAEGTTSVPGPRGAGDIIPSMLSPGEAVIPARQSEKYSGFINQIIQDKVPGFAGGLFPAFGAASTVGKGIPLSAGPAAFREAQQARYAARDAARKGLSLNARPLIPQIPGLVFEESSNGLIKVMAGDAFFYIKKDGLPKLQGAMKEHQEFMVSSGQGSKTLSEIIKQIKRPGGGKNPRAPHQGRTITPSDFYKTLPKWGQARNRTQGIDVANKRYDLLLKSKNPHLLKLKNYLETEEKEYLRSVLPPEVFSTLNFEAKRLAPSHIREVGTERAGSWTPDRIARDWDWFNKALIGTKMGNVSGAHPLNPVQAQEIIKHLLLKRQNKKSLGQDLSARQQGLLAALQYRINRKPSFYDDFVVVDNAMMKRMPKTMNLADGILSVPGPKGAGDIQPAMLAPGEAVIPARQSEKYAPLLNAIAQDSVPGFQGPGMGGYIERPSGIIVPSSARIDDPWDQPSTIKQSKMEAKIDKAVDRFGATKFGQKLSNAFDNMAVKANNAAIQTDRNAAATQNATKSNMNLIRGYDAQEKAQLKNARQLQQMNNAGKMMGVGMATSMLPMIGMAQASQNPDGFFARNMSSLMAVSMASMIAPMLNTPAKLLAGAAVSYAAVLFMQSKQIKKAIQEGRGLAEQFSMTTKKLEDFGTVTGAVSVTQEMEQRRLGRTATITPVSQEFGETFLSGDVGKKFQADFQQLSKDYESAVAGQMAVAQLASAVNQGVLSYLQAESVITKMARDLRNPNLEFQMQGQLMKILGPDGQDISKDPLKVQVELLLANDATLKESFKGFGKVVKDEIGLSRSEIGGLVGGAGAGALLAQGAYSRSLAAQTAGAARVAPMPLLAVGATIATIATRVYQMGKQSERIGKAASIVQGISAQNLQAVQQSMDAYNYQYDKQIQILQLEKDRTTNANQLVIINNKINELERKRADGMEILKDKQQEIIANYISMAKELSIFEGKTTAEQVGAVVDPVNLALNIFESRKAKEKLRESALIGMQKAWGDSFSSKLLGMQLEGLDIETQLAISLIVESKAVTPEAMLVLKKVLEQNGRDIDQQINLIINAGGVDALTRIATIVERLGAGKAAESFENLLNPKIKKGLTKEVDDILTAVEEYMKFPDTIPLELDFEVTGKNDIKRLQTLGKEIKEIKSRFPSGKIDLNALTKYQQELNGEGVSNSIVNAAIKNWQFLATLPPEKRFQAVFSYKFTESADSFQKDVDIALATRFQKTNQQFVSGTKENLALLAKLRDQYGVTGPNSAFVVFNSMYQGALNAWKQSKAGINASKEETEKVMREWFGAFFPEELGNGNNTPNVNTGPKLDTSWLNDLVQRLKLFKEASLNATKPLDSIRKFFGKDAKKSINPLLDINEGALEDLENAAKKAGIVLEKDFVDIIRGLDSEQFKLFADKFLVLAKNGRIKGLKDDFILINRAMEENTISTFIDNLKTANDEIDNQVVTYKKLVSLEWDSVEAAKAAADATFAAKIAAGVRSGDVKFFNPDDLKEYRREMNRIIPLMYEASMIKLAEDTEDLEAQIKAYDILTKAQIKQETILEILKNKAFAWGIANGQSIDDVVTKTEAYLALLSKLEKTQETFESKMQGAIDINVAALDLQAKVLQNQFDRENFGLKASIELAQDSVEKVNKQIQDEQDKIDAINLDIKYDKTFGDNVIADLQETINDMQRVVEESYDRPISVLQERSSVLSNDLTLMDRAAESINEKYDAQVKALEQVSQINQDIINQQKGQIDLSSALTQGDIASAAKAAQEMRSQAASAASQQSGNLINVARQAELGRVTSISGMTRKQIEQEQFDISQKIYNLELSRKKTQADIVLLEDELYNKQELREEKTLLIRQHETKIDELRTKDLKEAQTRLDNLQNELERREKILKAELDAIDKKKLSWEATQLALDAYKLALDEINKGELKTMQDMINDIVAKFNSIKGKVSGSVIIGSDTDVNDATDDNGDGVIDGNDASVIANANAAAADAEAALAAAFAAAEAAAEAADAAAAHADAAADATDAANAATDAENAAAQLNAELEKWNAEFAGISAANEAMRIALIKKLEKAGKKVPNSLLKRTGGQGAGGRFGIQYESKGGLINPKYFAMGGFARGTDTVPAMLTPGEYVVNRNATSKFLPELEAMNNMKMPAFSKSLSAPTYGIGNGAVISMPVRAVAGDNTNNTNNVYNYSVGINVGGTNASPDNIARAVMNEIKYIDSQRIRGQR